MTTSMHTAPGPFFELSAAPLAILAEDGSILRANSAFESMFGASGGDFVPLLSVADQERVRSVLASLGKSESRSFDAAPKTKAGEKASGTAGFHATRMPEGHVLLCATPASEQRRHDELRIAVFNRVLESGPVAYFAMNTDGVYTLSEGRLGERIGLSPADTLGKNALAMWKDAGGNAYEYVVRALAGEEVHAKASVPGIDTELWYLPIYDRDGNLAGSAGFCIDQTEQVQAERKVREQLEIVERQKATLELFARVLGSAPLVFWGIDAVGKVTLMEGKGAEVLGLEPAKVVGRNLIEMYRDVPEIAGSVVRALGGEEVRTLTTYSEGVHFDSWFMPLRGREGEAQGALLLSLNASERVRSERELRDKLELIERQSSTIRALATPIIRIWDEILCLPVIGTVDSARTADMMHALLEAIVRDQARYAIIDLTGVEVVDTSTADHLIQLFRAAKVLGVDGVLCGIRPAVAQTVVALGLELGSVKTMRTLRDALKWCIRSRGVGPVVSSAPGRVALPTEVANSNGQSNGLSHARAFASGAE